MEAEPIRKLGLIAGNGRFPFLLLDAARAQGISVVVAAIKEETDPEINALLPPGLSALGGEVTTVYAHSIVVTTAKDSIVLHEGQYLLTLPDGTDILLPEEPHFLHVDPTPDPAACSGGD